MAIPQQIENLVETRIDHFPLMPQSVAEIMRIGHSTDFLMEDLVRLVSSDPLLAARVLRLCNSSYFGIQREISGIKQAVSLLGFQSIRRLVLSSFVHSTIPREFQAYGQSAEALWKHSLGVATACLALSEILAPELADSAHTAGLIHDLGKLALENVVEAQDEALFTRMATKVQSFVEAEKDILGINHAEVGALVAKRWQLPPSLVEVIRFHHQPERAVKAHRLAALLGVADGLCHTFGIGTGVDGTNCQIDPWSLQCLGLQETMGEYALGQATERLMDLEDSGVISTF